MLQYLKKQKRISKKKRSSVIVNEPKLTEFDVNQLNSRLHTDTDNENFHIFEPGTANRCT